MIHICICVCMYINSSSTIPVPPSPSMDLCDIDFFLLEHNIYSSPNVCRLLFLVEFIADNSLLSTEPNISIYLNMYLSVCSLVLMINAKELNPIKKELVHKSCESIMYENHCQKLYAKFQSF